MVAIEHSQVSFNYIENRRPYTGTLIILHESLRNIEKCRSFSHHKSLISDVHDPCPSEFIKLQQRANRAKQIELQYKSDAKNFYFLHQRIWACSHKTIIVPKSLEPWLFEQNPVEIFILALNTAFSDFNEREQIAMSPFRGVFEWERVARRQRYYRLRRLDRWWARSRGNIRDAVGTRLVLETGWYVVTGLSNDTVCIVLCEREQINSTSGKTPLSFLTKRDEWNGFHQHW